MCDLVGVKWFCFLEMMIAKNGQRWKCYTSESSCDGFDCLRSWADTFSITAKNGKIIQMKMENLNFVMIRQIMLHEKNPNEMGQEDRNTWNR